MALGDLVGGAACADDNQRIGAGELRRQRRAQRPRGKHPAIAETAVAVDDDQRRVLGDRRILKAVIHQDHAGVARPRQRRALDAVARHHHGDRARHHQRLVADVGGGVMQRIDVDRTAQAAAIAAAQHHRCFIHFPQQPHQGKGRRRLAGAADMVVSDAQDRNADIKARPRQSAGRDRAIERAQRHQQSRQQR